MTQWTFHTAERASSSPRAKAEQAESDVKHLEHREAELVRRLVTLKERHAFFPNEVTSRQIDEFATKLDDLRAELDAARAVLPPDPNAA